MLANIKKTLKSIYYISVLILAPALCILATVVFCNILSPLFGSGADGGQTATPSEAETEALISDEELLSIKQEAMGEQELSQSDILAANRSSWSGSEVKVVIVRDQNLVVVYGADSDGAYTLPLYVMLCSVGAKVEEGEYTIGASYTWKKTEYSSDDGAYVRWNHYNQVFGSYEIGSTDYTDKDPSTLVTSSYNQLGSTSDGARVLLDDYDARILYDICQEGTVVSVTAAGQDFVVPTKLEIGENCYWDPTNNSQTNPWYSASAGTVSVSKETVTVERGGELNLYRYVLALDEDGNAANASLVLEGQVDTMTVGEYKVTYTLPLSDGTGAQGVITYVVEDTTGPTITYPLNVNVVCDTDAAALKNTQTQITAYIESLISVADLGEEIANENANIKISYLVTGSLSTGYQRYEITATDSYGNVTVAEGRVYIRERQDADLMIDISEEILETTTTEETTTEETTTTETTTQTPEATTQTPETVTTTTQKQTTTTTEKQTTTTTTTAAEENTDGESSGGDTGSGGTEPDSSGDASAVSEEPEA